MTTSIDQLKVLAPEESERADLRQLVSALAPERTQQAKLIGPDGDELPLPENVYEAFREVVTAMSRGLAVTVTPLHTMLTTQQAADMLNVSRPTLVKLLEDGQIPYEQRSRHRRVRLADVLDYEQRSRRQRTAMLDEMARDAEEDGSAYDDIGFMHTR